MSIDNVPVTDEEMQRARHEEKQKRQERLKRIDLGELVSELVSLAITFDNNNKSGTYSGDDYKRDEQRKEELISELGRRESYYLPPRRI